MRADPFYEHFENNQACFLTTGEEPAERWVRRVAEAVDRAMDEEGDAIAAFVDAVFGATLAAGPSELRLMAGELAAAETAEMERREQVLDTLGRIFHRARRAGAGDHACDVDGAEDAKDAPGGWLASRALAGAIVHIPHTRVLLRGGRVRRPPRGGLLALAPEVADWAASYRVGEEPAPTAPAGTMRPIPIGGRAPGTLSLSPGAVGGRGLVRGEGALWRSLVVHSERERLLDAVANLSAGKGYATVTIPEIVHEAAVSVEAFYEHFDGREDALLVAYALGRRKLAAVMERAFRVHEKWLAGVRASIETMLAFLASEPSFAHMALIDVRVAGGGLAAAAAQGGALAELLWAGMRVSSHGKRPPAIAVEASAIAVGELCHAYVAAARTRELQTLGAVAAHLALTPFAATGVPD
jgi:AcrR family transcriptional regulator